MENTTRHRDHCTNTSWAPPGLASVPPARLRPSNEHEIVRAATVGGPPQGCVNSRDLNEMEQGYSRSESAPSNTGVDYKERLRGLLESLWVKIQELLKSLPWGEIQVMSLTNLERKFDQLTLKAGVAVAIVLLLMGGVYKK